MATVADEWKDVDDALARLERHGAFRPAAAPMRRLVERIRQDATFADVHPVVSHASLVLARGATQRRVMVAWHEDDIYVVYFVDPPLELSERRLVREDAVLQVLREYLDTLGDA